MELFGPKLLTNFLHKKSDFLGIFKNILTGFHCTYFQLALNFLENINKYCIMALPCLLLPQVGGILG
jgi:hypothetical protein